MPKKTTKTKESEVQQEEKKEQIILLTSGDEQQAEEEMRCVGVIGEISEEKATETLYGMLMMQNTSKEEVLVDEGDPEKGTEIISKPFEMIISTYGGSAVEMFGIYDMMRRIREDCPIHSTAIGKVMSAGVLLLAAGTKGERRIGANCRVMIHDVKGGSMGDVTDLENEFAEIKWIQERYIKILASETDMTENYIKKLIKKKVNVYLSAQEAVELGIADEIF